MIRDKNYVNCIRVDPFSNQMLLSGDNMGKVRLFDLHVLDGNEHNRSERCSSNSTTHPECHSKMVTSIAWYPLDSGMFITSSTDGNINVWDTEQFDIVSHIRFKHPVTDVQMPLTGPFSHKLAAACTGVHGVTLVDLFAGSHSQVLDGNVDKGTCCQWHPRNEYELLVGDSKGVCLLYDIRKTSNHNVLGVLGQGFAKTTMKPPSVPYSALSCLFSPDGNRIVMMDASPHPIHVYDSTSLQEESIQPIDISSWGSIVTKPTIAGAGERNYLLCPDPLRCTICIIDLDGGDIIHRLVGHMDIPTCCAFREKTNELFSSGRDGFILKYDHSHLLKD